MLVAERIDTSLPNVSAKRDTKLNLKKFVLQTESEDLTGFENLSGLASCRVKKSIF